MGNDRKMQNMSVEDILKSIKGIIDKRNDDDDTNEINVEDDVLELTDIVGLEDDKPPLDLEDVVEENLMSNKSSLETSSILKQFADKAKSVVKESKKAKILTVEELVVEMLRPQLKQWLDENLPLLVKELVEKEIKRLIPHEEE